MTIIIIKLDDYYIKVTAVSLKDACPLQQDVIRYNELLREVWSLPHKFMFIYYCDCYCADRHGAKTEDPVFS